MNLRLLSVTRHSARSRRARRRAIPLAGAFAAAFGATPTTPAGATNSCEGTGAATTMVCWDHVHTLAKTDAGAAAQGAPYATSTVHDELHYLTQAQDISGTQGAPYATISYSTHNHASPGDGPPGYYTTTQTWVSVDHWHQAYHNHPYSHWHAEWHWHPNQQKHGYEDHWNRWQTCETTNKDGSCALYAYTIQVDNKYWNHSATCSGWLGYPCGHGNRWAWWFYNHPYGDVWTVGSGTYWDDHGAPHLHGVYDGAPGWWHNHSCAYLGGNETDACHLHAVAADGPPGWAHPHTSSTDGSPGYFTPTQTWVAQPHTHETVVPARHVRTDWTYPVHRHLVNAGDNCTLDPGYPAGVCPS